MPTDRNRQSVISPRDADRAIYIDFEGFADHSPTLLGILIGDQFEQVVLDSELTSAADAKGMRLSTVAAEASQLQARSLGEQRVVVAYSQHELNVLRTYAQTEIGEVYRDARKIAKRWINRLHPDAPIQEWTLKEFLKFIEHPRGNHLGFQQSTARIRAVRDMLRKKRSYDALTPVAKAKWTKLLDHNEIDCRGMRALVQRAASELAAR